MQPTPPTVGRVVRYREGDSSNPAIVIAVHEDGRVNLTVFSQDGHTYGRFGVATGDANGQWSWPPGAPAAAAAATGGVTDADRAKLSELATLVQQEMTSFDQLNDAVRAESAKQQEQIDALQKQVADLTAKLAAKNEPAPLPPAPSSPPTAH